MPKKSAGLLMYRVRDGALEILLVHLGGPFWAKKDKGAWFLPKGELSPGEDEVAAAKREFEEETGLKPTGSFLPLGSVKHKSGKTVTAWAFEGDCEPSAMKSNTFTIEWPPRSGKQGVFPEIDRAAFFTIEAARDKMHPAEFEFATRLATMLSGKSRERSSPPHP
jgi:predicted NUDIX family NTP pyrophosphohydrolase